MKILRYHLSTQERIYGWSAQDDIVIPGDALEYESADPFRLMDKQTTVMKSFAYWNMNNPFSTSWTCAREHTYGTCNGCGNKELSPCDLAREIVLELCPLQSISKAAYEYRSIMGKSPVFYL